MRSLSYKIAVMQYFEAGGDIEVRYKEEKGWTSTTNPSWDWVSYDYRQKPVPAVALKIEIDGRVFVSAPEVVRAKCEGCCFQEKLKSEDGCFIDPVDFDQLCGKLIFKEESDDEN